MLIYARKMSDSRLPYRSKLYKEEIRKRSSHAAERAFDVPNFTPESPSLSITKTLIAGLSESKRDRLLTWLAASYDECGRAR